MHHKKLSFPFLKCCFSTLYLKSQNCLQNAPFKTKMFNYFGGASPQTPLVNTSSLRSQYQIILCPSNFGPPTPPKNQAVSSAPETFKQAQAKPCLTKRLGNVPSIHRKVNNIAPHLNSELISAPPPPHF